MWKIHSDGERKTTMLHFLNVGRSPFSSEMDDVQARRDLKIEVLTIFVRFFYEEVSEVVIIGVLLRKDVIMANGKTDVWSLASWEDF